METKVKRRIVKPLTSIEKTKELLGNYKALAVYVQQAELDIESMIQEGMKRRSSDIIRMKHSSLLDPDDIVEENIQKKIARIEKAKRAVDRINIALSILDIDRRYKGKGRELVELLYFRGYTIEDAAEELDMSDSTVKRWHRLIISKLALSLQGP